MKRVIALLLGITFAGLFCFSVKAEETTFGFFTERQQCGIASKFSTQELYILYHVVEAEAYGWRYENYRNVANVIFNRYRHGWGTLYDILCSPRQFMVVTTKFYHMVIPSAAAILAVDEAWAHDYTRGALYFDSTNGRSYAARHCEFLFRDSAGHDFYK